MEYIVAHFQISCSDGLLQVARDLLADAAAEAGFESFEDTPDGLKGYVQKDLFDRQQLDANLADFPLENTSVTYTLDKVESKDWNETWEEAGFEPINIDGRVVIFDARQGEQKVPEGAIPVYIYARQAFGTGTHQTTRMAVSMLLNTELKGKQVLDCGTGTGILGIVASKMGASEVVGYDIDEWSVENSRHNAERNGVDNLTVLYGDATVLGHTSGLFDVVVANINRNILINDMPAFKEVMASDATLILSGFYLQDVPLLIEKAESLGLHEVERKVEDNWCSLKFQA